MRVALVLFACLAAACGSPPCASETTACGCYQRAQECRLVTESCWCPSECNASVQCVCGGGKFLRCEAAADAGP